ncbi:hypothetical protein ACSLNT_30605, partial [Escherichia coli]|uniref:hypothetical protein n=1 Tax=Escherichia coli TaxID=562 RepID=UPI003EE2EA8D
KKYSPGSNFAKWMLQEIKRLIANIMSGSRSVNTEILNYFHPIYLNGSIKNRSSVNPPSGLMSLLTEKTPQSC